MLSLFDKNNSLYLTNSERLVMKVNWDADHELVLHEILQECVEKYGKDWKSQTVSTYLRHLVDKKFLKLKRVGRDCRYEVLVSAKDFYEKDAKNFAEYWNMDAQAVLALMSNGNFS